MTIDYKITHVEDALDRLPEQFKNATNLKHEITSFMIQAQEIEDAANQVFDIVDLDNAKGIQLDGIGSVVGEQRQGLDDTNYLVAIKARIMINCSQGTTEDINAVLNFITGLVPNVRDVGIAHFDIEIGSMTLDLATRLKVYVGQTKAAGVGFSLIYWITDLPFRFNSGPGYDLGHYAGVL